MWIISAPETAQRTRQNCAAVTVGPRDYTTEVFDNIVRYQYRPYVGLSLIITLVIRNIYVSLSSQSRNVVISLSHLISVAMDAHILSHYHLSLTM